VQAYFKALSLDTMMSSNMIDFIMAANVITNSLVVQSIDRHTLQHCRALI
jgi:hypothetical protein